MKNMIVGCLCIVWVGVGCVAPTSDPAPSVCTQAQDHLAACTQSSVSLPAVACTSDEAQAARQLLNTPCEVLSDPAAAGKADYWGSGNPLCLFLVAAKDHPAGSLCCFDRNCGGEGVCLDYECVAPAVPGESCERAGHCEDGFVCGVADRCVKPALDGEACENRAHCEFGLVCIGGFCADKSVEDGECDGDQDNDCGSGLRCEGGACVPKVETGGACEQNQDCAGVLTCAQGTCAPAGRGGAPCDTGDGFDCDFNFVCIGGTCKPEPGPGDACEREPSFMCGRGFTCWNQVCEAVHAKGGACEGLFDCESGLFCRNAVCAD